MMQIDITEIGSNTRKISLCGRLDSPGVNRIETRFAAAAAAAGGYRSLVDLSGVSFVASMGIRMFIATARAAAKRNGRLVLYGPQPLVREVLDHVALGDIIPIVEDEAHAVEALGS